MMNRPTMHTTKRILGLILVLIYLFGCTYPVGLTNVPLQASTESTVDQTLLLTPQETLSPPASTITVITPSADTGTSPVTPQPSGAVTALVAGVTFAACQLEPVTQPPWPVKTLLPNELDQETGLHMTGRPQLIDLATYRLKVTGMVDHPLNLTYDDLRCMPKVTDSPILICPGVFTDEATWTGVSIKHILELAVVQPGAKELTLVSADGLEMPLPLKTASADKNFLAFEVNGKTLPVQHGFPLRAVFPSMWGSYWLKWLVELRIS